VRTIAARTTQRIPETKATLLRVFFVMVCPTCSLSGAALGGTGAEPLESRCPMMLPTHLA
jgi:hypothetical protein